MSAMQASWTHVVGMGLVLGLVAVVVLGLGASAEHATCTTFVHAGGNIQENITAAADNDVICVESGTYQESLTVNKTGLVLQNSNATDFPVLDGASTLQTGMEVVNGSITVEGFNVTGFTGNGINVTAGSVTIRDANVSGNAEIGVLFTGVAASDGVLRDTLLTGNSGFHAVRIDSGADRVTIEANNVSSNAADGISASQAKDIRIANNTVHANNVGIRVASETGAILDSNTVTSNAFDGILVSTFAHDTVIRDNTVNDNTDKGIFIDDSDDVVISGLSATGNGAWVLHIRDSSRTRVSDATITANTDNAVTVQTSDNFTLENSFIDGNQHVSISSTPDAFVANNTISNATGAGSEGLFFNNAARAVADNNKVVDNGANGIEVRNSDDVDLRDNTVTGNGVDGINVWDGSARVTIRTSDVSSNTDDGIELNDAPNATIANNTVLDSGGEGIDVGDGAGSSSGATIRDNLVNGSAQNGVTVESDDLLIVDNVVRDSGSNGILFEAGATSNAVRDTMVTASGLWAFNTTAGGINFAERLDVGASTKSDTLLSFEARNASVRGNGSSQPSNADAEPLGRYLDAEANDAGAYLDITVHYLDGDVSGLDESTVAIWRLDGGSWTELASTVDAGANTVTRNVTSFSVFGAFAQEETTDDGGTGDGDTDDDGPSPDFVVTSATVSVTTTVVGENVTVTATVENQGDASGTQGVSFFMDDGTIRSRSLTLAVGESGTVSLTHQYDEPGTYDVRVGGVAAGTVTVTAPGGPGQPDIRVTDPSLDPMTVTVGGSAEACGTFENVGGAAGTVTVSVDVDGRTVGTEQVSVAAGGQETVCRSFTPSESGDVEVRVNGALAGTLSVQAADDGDGGDGPGPIPGFGPVVAALALAGVAWVVKRRR